MSGSLAALLGFFAMLGLIALRMPVGLAMIVVGATGYLSFAGPVAFLAYMKSTPYHLFSNYTLSVIPLFIIMGAFAEKTGLSTALFKAAAGFIGHRRGGLTMAVIAACTAFGAICGSAIATTATFGRATLPELRRYNYEDGFAAATIAVGGTLGILIPPSVVLVVYAIATEQNIAKLFMAALMPGIIAAIFYCITIAFLTSRNPAIGPALPPASNAERFKSLLAIWPAVAVALIVVGGIYGGVFTPTEAAAVGAVAMLAIGLLQRTLGWQEFRQSLMQTAETTAMICLILLGAEIFNGFLALSQLPTEAANAVVNWGLPPYGVLIVFMIVYVILGGLMDELAMILLTLPVFFPIIQALDFGMPPDDVAIWFGILVLMVVGIGLTSPPIALNIFVVTGIARDIPIAKTFRAVLPYIAVDLFRLACVIAFPGLALWLVHLLN